jgi:signal transduction histidine kinase
VSAEVDAVRAVAAARRVRLESFIDSGAGPLEGDAERLRQVIHNLLAHAIVCTPAGGNVIVECRGRQDHAELVVRDNGIGIAAEMLPHVFDPAWQMRRVRADGVRTGGVWLGLAVVHQIVELHGGRVVAASGGPGMGAVFTVGLPLMAASQADTRSIGVGKIPASARSAGRIGAR